MRWRKTTSNLLVACDLWKYFLREIACDACNSLYPNPLDATAWAEPPTVNKTTGGVSGGNVLSSIGLKHFVACKVHKQSTVACGLWTCFDRMLVTPDVKGAAGIRINTTKRLHG